MPSEVYLCGWKKIRGKYRLWWKADETVFAEAADFEDASEELSEKIGDETHDREAVLEFLPPPPPATASLKRWTQPEILNLGYNEHVKTNIREAGMYTGGYCPRCGKAVGTRTSKPLQIHGKSAAIPSWPSVPAHLYACFPRIF